MSSGLADQRRGRVTGSALETAHHVGARISPRAQFVRAIDPSTGGMVGKEQRFVRQALQKTHTRNGIGFTQRFSLPIKTLLKFRHEPRLVVRRRQNDTAVLALGNVPLKTLKDDDLRAGFARGDKFFVRAFGDDFGVCRPAVIRDDAETETVLGGGLDLRKDLVTTVAAVFGVDVVVAPKPLALGIRRDDFFPSPRRIERGGTCQNQQTARSV